MTTIDSRYFRKRLRELQEEYDRALRSDGDQLKHARATDILVTVRRDFDHALYRGREKKS